MDTLSPNLRALRQAREARASWESEEIVDKMKAEGGRLPTERLEHMTENDVEDTEAYVRSEIDQEEETIDS